MENSRIPNFFFGTKTYKVGIKLAHPARIRIRRGIRIRWLRRFVWQVFVAGRTSILPSDEYSLKNKRQVFVHGRMPYPRHGASVSSIDEYPLINTMQVPLQNMGRAFVHGRLPSQKHEEIHGRIHPQKHGQIFVHGRRPAPKLGQGFVWNTLTRTRSKQSSVNECYRF